MLTFNQFEVGDIVKIKRTPSQSNPFKSEGRELYKIADICGNEIKLDWELEAYSIKEISPIIIDRKEDSIIHLNHKKSAHSFILAGMQEPRESNLREYYLDTAHKLGWVKLLIYSMLIKYSVICRTISTVTPWSLMLKKFFDENY